MQVWHERLRPLATAAWQACGGPEGLALLNNVGVAVLGYPAVMCEQTYEARAIESALAEALARRKQERLDHDPDSAQDQ